MTLRKLIQSLAAMTMLVGVGLGGVVASPAGASTQDGTTAAISDDSPSAQITRLYEAFFLRTPPEADRVFWVNDLNSGNRTLQEIADFFASGQEFEDTYGDLSNRDFVEQVYLNVQGRPGETEGVDFWTGELDNGNRTRGGVMVGFSNGEEFREVLLERFDDSAIFRLYCAFFLREPDDGGRTFWKTEFANGASITEIADRFALVPEFEAAFGSDTTDEQFVDRVYVNTLDRERGADETFWLDELTSGAFTRGRVMIGFSEAPEYVSRFTSDPPNTCPVNGASVDAPVATDDTATTGTAVAVIVDVLSNDTGDDISITQLNDPSNGTVVDNEDGTVTYTPNTGFNGDDTFTYVIGNAGGTSTGTVTVTVAAGAPTANADALDGTYNPAEGSPTPDVLSVIGNDELNGNSITAAGSTADGTDGTTDNGGTVVVNGDNTISYTAPGDFRGVDGATDRRDTFTYTIGSGATASTSTVSVSVEPRELSEINCGIFLNPPVTGDPMADPVIDARDNYILFLRSGGCFQPYEFMPDGTGTLTLSYTNLAITVNSGTPIPRAAVADGEIAFNVDVADLLVDADPDTVGDQPLQTGDTIVLTGDLEILDGARSLATNNGFTGTWTVSASGSWVGISGDQSGITLLVDPFTGLDIPG